MLQIAEVAAAERTRRRMRNGDRHDAIERAIRRIAADRAARPERHPEIAVGIERQAVGPVPRRPPRAQGNGGSRSRRSATSKSKTSMDARRRVHVVHQSAVVAPVEAVRDRDADRASHARDRRRRADTARRRRDARRCAIVPAQKRPRRIALCRSFMRRSGRSASTSAIRAHEARAGIESRRSHRAPRARRSPRGGEATAPTSVPIRSARDVRVSGS